MILSSQTHIKHQIKKPMTYYVYRTEDLPLTVA